MTFILAVQLKDSIVVAADNRAVNLVSEANHFTFFDTEKLMPWADGVMVGCGERQVIASAVDLFQHFAQGNITKLPHCLKLARSMRGLAFQHPQIEASKLLCSSTAQHGPQLYIVSTDEHGVDQLTTVPVNQLLLWMFNPNIHHIFAQLQTLYASLKAYACFADLAQWMAYYRQQFATIYQIQAEYDEMMSSSFDIFFQTQTESVWEHIPNISHAAIDI